LDDGAWRESAEKSIRDARQIPLLSRKGVEVSREVSELQHATHSMAGLEIQPHREGRDKRTYSHTAPAGEARLTEVAADPADTILRSRHMIKKCVVLLLLILTVSSARC
jgi:hypothetical protein